MAETRHALYTREFLEQARAFTDAPGMAGDAAATVCTPTPASAVSATPPNWSARTCGSA